jgi:hypothetical protein
MRLLALVVPLLALSCSEGTPKSAFKAATDKEAETVVRDFLDAAHKGDAKSVAEKVCDGGEDRAAAAVNGPLKIDGYDITHVEPAWVGSEPYFRVDVALKKASGVDARSLSVRAREGCVDRLLGEPVERAKPGDGEIAL